MQVTKIKEAPEDSSWHHPGMKQFGIY